MNFDLVMRYPLKHALGFQHNAGGIADEHSPMAPQAMTRNWMPLVAKTTTPIHAPKRNVIVFCQDRSADGRVQRGCVVVGKPGVVAT
jgi:hypothetical protein